MLFVCCVYVLQLSMATVALLQDGVIYGGSSRLNVWCALLTLINCGTLLLMQNKNGRILMNYANFVEICQEICNKDSKCGWWII
jgi:hypothetical protein